jgi:lysozyme
MPREGGQVTLNGYDISAYQGQLNPTAVPADFVIVKITGGDGYVNPNWQTQLNAARAAGKLVGVYHFARDGFTGSTAQSEANWFIQHAAPILDGTVVAYLDWEGDNVGDVGFAKAWLDIVTSQTGVKPLIYLSYATITAYDWSSVANAGYGLWESAYVLGYQKIYGYAPPAGRSPIPYWGTIAEWQYTSSGQLPEWPNDLDLDIFYGDANTWAAYAAKNGTITPQAAAVTPLDPNTQFLIDLFGKA